MRYLHIELQRRRHIPEARSEFLEKLPEVFAEMERDIAAEDEAEREEAELAETEAKEGRP